MKLRKVLSIGLQGFAVLLVIVPALAVGQATPHKMYPNELEHLKLYDQYLAPLRPYISLKAEIVQTLGSDQGKELAAWRIQVLFVGDYKSNTVNGHLWAQNITGHLASLELIPKRRVS